MQKGLLLISELEGDEEAWALNQVVPVVLSGTLNDHLIILQLIDLQNIASLVILERIIVEGLLIVPVCVLLQRAHAIGGHRSFINDASESLEPKIVPCILIIILIVLVV